MCDVRFIVLTAFIALFRIVLDKSLTFDTTCITFKTHTYCMDKKQDTRFLNK